MLDFPIFVFQGRLCTLYIDNTEEEEKQMNASLLEVEESLCEAMWRLKDLKGLVERSRIHPGTVHQLMSVQRQLEQVRGVLLQHVREGTESEGCSA